MSQSVLINALSGFWHRFFADLGDIDALYQGVEALASQLYIDMAHEVLGASMVDAPLARKEAFRLLRVRDTDIKKTQYGWLVPAPVEWHNVRYVQDGVAVPTTVLDAGRGFRLTADGLLFTEDPRKMLPRAASRAVRVPTGGFLETANTEGVNPGDVVRLADGREFKVLVTTEKFVAFTSDNPVDKNVPSVTWSVPASGISGRTGLLSAGVRKTPTEPPQVVVREWAYWAVDSRVDDALLYRSFGTGDVVQPSTEAYRLFLRGVSRLYTCGPSLERIRQALTAAVGVPLAVRDGETVVEVVPGESYEIITTDQRCALPPGVLPIPGLRNGTALRAFQVLANVVEVFDETAKPGWWHGVVIPESLLPGVSAESRTADPRVSPNKIDAKSILGSPGLVIGSPWRRTVGYELTNAAYKRNLFGVKLAAVLQATAATRETIRSIAQEGSPAHVMVVML